MVSPLIESIKKIFTSNISLAFIGVILLLLISWGSFYVQQQQQRVAIEKQTSRTDQLIVEIKALSEENRNLNKQNRDYAYCNSVLLAKYTQDQQPIVIEDLDKCAFKSYDREVITPQVKANAQSFLAPEAPNSSPVTSSPPAPQQTTTQQTQPAQMTPTPQNKLPLCVDVLSLVKTCK